MLCVLWCLVVSCSDAGPVRHIKVAKGGKATVYFVLATDAARCVKDLQGLEIAGNPLKLMLGESEEAVTAAGAADDKLSDKPLPQYTKLNTRLFRLVVRNLPFGIKEAAVRSAFEAFGTLEEVHLPLICGRDGKDQTRGFGFLQYSSRTEAKKALDDGNGMELLGRKVAVDWAVAKEIYQEMVPQKANQTPNAKDSDASAPPDATKRKQPDDAAAADDGKGKKKKAEGEEKQAELVTVYAPKSPLSSLFVVCLLLSVSHTLVCHLLSLLVSPWLDYAASLCASGALSCGLQVSLLEGGDI